MTKPRSASPPVAPRLSPLAEDLLERLGDGAPQPDATALRGLAERHGQTERDAVREAEGLCRRDLAQRDEAGRLRLTEAGRAAARRVGVRHDLWRWFFADWLGVDPETAERDACAVEHAPSDETTERLVRFYEAAVRRPELSETWKNAAMMNQPSAADPAAAFRPISVDDALPTLAMLKPGQSGVVLQIRAKGAVRQRLIDMGMLPHTELLVERVAPTGDPIWIRMKGFQLSLRLEEAREVLLMPPTPPALAGSARADS